jgi:radical SAM superfamily enzyme YgiQ (UPF0313 family)
LAFREGNKVIINEIRYRSIKEIPMIDRELTPTPEVYFENYNQHFGKWHQGKRIKNAVTKNAQGCSRGSSERCVYCNIPDMSFRYRTPNEFWQEIEYLRTEHGINFVFETADSLASFARVRHGTSNYLEELARTRPSDLDTELFVFARAEEINPQTITYFSDLNVKRVNMGLDSGDDTMLERGITKGRTSVDVNWNAVDMLHDAGIQMYVSFVLGGIGESEQSLENTLRFAGKLLEYDHVVVVDPSPLLPLPGSPSWKLVGDKFFGQDLIDTEEAATHWAEKMCNVDFDTLKSYNNQIQELAKSKGRVVGGYGIKNV